MAIPHHINEKQEKVDCIIAGIGIIIFCICLTICLIAFKI